MKLIAEISSNHNRDLTRALKLIEAAAEVGCQAVKFQLFKLDQLFAPWALHKKPELRARKEWELPVSWLPALSRTAHDYGLEFACTPFYPAAIEELYDHVDFYKISSYQVLQHNFLHQVAQTGKPVVLSTGMATLPEITRAVDALCGGNCMDITLLHCVSAYPAPPGECNLATIASLRETFKPNYSVRAVGWSDHSHSQPVVMQAVLGQQATVVELHFDLADTDGVETQMGHCWTPAEVVRLKRDLDIATSAVGFCGKSINASEYHERLWRSDPHDGLRPLLETRKG